MKETNDHWERLTVPVEEVLDRIEPGMSIFLGTGAAEPRTFVKHLMASEAANLQDLEVVQLFSFGDAVCPNDFRYQNFRLKTFFSGWLAGEAISEGRVDWIPSRFSRIPGLIASGQISIDVAVIQVTPPNQAGYCSLGVAVDVARQAMDQASIVVGEINTRIPFTFGDTFVHVSDFDFLIHSTEPIIYFNRWPVDKIFDGVASNLASVIEDGTCMAFSAGPLFESLTGHLAGKQHLGVHSPIFTDGLMDLVVSGVVTNRKKEIWRGKSLVSYAVGTPELMAWLDRNPLVEFQSVDKVYEPTQIGRNRHFTAIFQARKVDLSGRIALHGGRGNVAAEPGEAMDLLNGAEISPGGRAICALPSRNRQGWPNIRISVATFPYLFTLQESVDMVATEYGVANLTGRTVRERAQALIDIAHPDDRRKLVEQAKEARILYKDQIFIEESACIYPAHIANWQAFDEGLKVFFRAIKPSDEEEMRHLFYRFSDGGVYTRYFSAIKTMPHNKMQSYVNVDYNQIISIVGLAGKPGKERIIGEARFTRYRRRPYGDIAFIVDEECQNRGIASYMYKMLIRLAKERGLMGFTADVLLENKAMMRVLEKGDLPVQAKLEQDILKVTLPFEVTSD